MSCLVGSLLLFLVRAFLLGEVDADLGELLGSDERAELDEPPFLVFSLLGPTPVLLLLVGAEVTPRKHQLVALDLPSVHIQLRSLRREIFETCFLFQLL
mmetsp:Transcript_18405/g.17516  ORF Transcript_18405/g.17516 Transcript_18405/m.17516 type:complete len:99 (+) Transcript_18405:686-982(+)